MPTDKRVILIPLAVTIVMLLNACNLGVTQPGLPPVSETPTLPPPSPTDTPTATLIPTVAPTFTVTLFHSSIPTITPTSQWTSCPGIVISVTDTKKGDILHVLRCEDGLEYDLGPLAKGFYAVGPNDKFMVYVTIDGFIFAARIGSRSMYNLFNLAREHEFTVFNKRVAPDFQLSFAGEGPIYRLVIVERNYDQKRVYELPVSITQ